MAHVHVKMTLATEFEGIPVSLVEGDSYDSEHPLVRARPELFESEPANAKGAPKVERATRAPGEARGSRRRN